MVFVLLIVINVQKIWVKDDYNPEYEKQMERASEYILKNDLGNGLAGHWDSAIISGFSNGKIIMLDGSSDIGNISKDYNVYSKALEEIPLNFVMEGTYEEYKPYFEVGNIEKTFGKADVVYKLEGFDIYYYNDGIHVKE